MTTRLCINIGHKSNRMNNFSSDTAGLATAVEKAGAALHAAGTSYSESLGLIVAANDSLQNPSTVGQMLKTMSMRLRGASAADLEKLGIDTEGMTQGKKSIVQQFKAMAGIDIMEGTDYKSTYRILDELHAKWESLNDAERAAITEAVGGKRGGSVMSSLMTNWEDAQKVVQMANNSTGSAMQEQAHYAESVQFSIDRLRASWQELAYNLLDSKALKGATEFLVNLLNALNEVTKATDGLIPVLAGLGAVGYTLMSLNGFVKTLGGLFKTLQAATEAKTEATVADTIANGQNAASELADAAAKDKTSQASAKLTGQQIAEMNAQKADTALNGAQALSESVKRAKKGQVIQYYGERPETPTLVREPKPLVSGKLGGALTTLGFDTTSTASMAAAGAIAAFVAALAAVGVTAYATYQHNEKLKESALELANAYNTSKSEIDGYKEQISDLYKTINDSNTSYEDARAAREQLLGVQNALIDKYGTEAENVQVVTEAVNGQVEALDKLNEKSWRQTVNDFNKTQGTGFLDFWNHLWHGANDNVGVMQDEMFNARVRIHATAIDDKEFLQQIEEAIGGEYEVDMNAGSLILSGDLNDVKDKLYQIQNAAEKIGVTDNFMQGLTKQINEVENTLTKYQDMADQWTFNEDIMPNYSEQFQQMQNGYKKYQDAIVNGNALAINEAKDGFADIFDGIGDAVAKDKNKDRILSYFRNMYPDLKSEIGSWQLGRDLANTTVDTLSVGFSDALSKFHSLEELKAAQTSADQEMQSSYMTVEALANQYGLTVDGLIAKLKELGQVPLNFRVNQTAVDRYQDAMYRNMGTYRTSEADKLDNIINQSQYKDQINTFGDAYWDAIAIAIKEAQDANDGLELSEEKLKETVEKTTEAYIEQANAANALQNIEPFSGKAFAEAKDELGNLTELYKKFVEQAEKDPAKIRLDISDVEKLREKWESVLGSDYFNQFEQTLTSPLSDEAEIMQAFNQAATEYVKKQIDMSGATEETGEMVKAELTQLGLLKSDVDAFVNSAVRAAQIEREVTAAKASGNEVTARLAELYAAEGASLGYTNEELVNYVVEMGQANGLEITGDLSWLDELCNKLGISIGWLNSFKAALNGATASGKAFDPRVKDYIPGGAPSDVFRSNVNKTNARVAQQIRLDRAADAFKIDTGKGGGGGGGSKDAEKETDVLAELSKQLDEIQAAYSSLSEIVKSYNENGKLTIDQAQELINTDFRYLAMLTDENGQLKLNEQGFQDLARAKLQEMQIQLAKNAIDTVNGLQSEADAVNFLTYAYEGLKGAALGATEAMLASAVAAAKMRGEQQGIAAEKIQAGYYATKQAIGNIDLGSDSLAGKKDSDKDKSDKDSKDKDQTEKETKTSFNWLDRLINKIQRDIDRLARRAEKYFSYMEKNALVDRQINANRRMIAAQELSVDYYQNKANKALKKVPKKYRNLISGDFDPATIKNLVQELGEGKTKKLQDYLNWQDLLEKAQDALEDAYAQERELINQKLDNVLDYFDTLNGYQQSILNVLDAQMKADAAKGYATDINKLLDSYATEREIYKTSGDRDQAYKEEADRNIEAIHKSYQNQLEDAQNDIKDTSTYQKLKDKNKKGKINVKQALVGDYQVLAEDVEAAKGWLDKLNKTLNKKGEVKKGKQGKYDEAKAELERLHKKYTDYIAELAVEEQEAIDKANLDLETQKNQNKADTTEAYGNYWSKLKEILDTVGHIYDLQIDKLGVIIDRYDILADTLKDVDDETIRSFGVTDLFGTSDQRADYLKNSLSESKRQVDLYHRQYEIYANLVDAAQTKDIQKFRNILRNGGIDSRLESVVQDLLDQLTNDLNFDMSNYETTWREGANTILSNISQIMKKAQEASDAIADAVTASFRKSIDALGLLQEAYTTRASLIKDDWTVDINGITEYGYAQVAELAQAMNVAQLRIDEAAQALKALEEEYMKPDTDMTDETYKEQKYGIMADQMKFEKDITSFRDQINELAKKAAQNELTQLQKLVDAYKKALNAKKSYYDYDKTLRDKNKNIQSLQSEIAALSNIGDAAAKARLKSLQAELEEAQKDLDDTVFEHSISIQNDALDGLVSDLTQQLDDSTKTFKEKIDEFNDNVTKLIDQSTKVDAGKVFNDIEDELKKQPNLNPTAEITTVDEDIRKKHQAEYDEAVRNQIDKQAEVDELIKKVADAEATKNSAGRTYTRKNTDANRRQAISNLKKQAETAQQDLDAGFVVIDGKRIKRELVDEYRQLLKRLSSGNPNSVSKRSLNEQILDIETRSTESYNKRSGSVTEAWNKYNTALKSYNDDVAKALKAYQDAGQTLRTLEAQLEQANKDLEGLNNKVASLKEVTSTSSKILQSAPAVEESRSQTMVLGASSSTVADDIASGVLSDLNTSDAQINSQLLSTLSEIRDIKSIVKLDNDFIPTISRNVTLITADVSNIAKDTNTITGQLEKMQKTLNHIDTNGGNNIVVTSGISINDLKQLGLKRTYK